MLIFYAWVALLAAIIISVPVVYMIEKKKNKVAEEPAESAGDELGEPEMTDDGAGASDEIPDEMAGFGEDIPAGEDDFSAFEKEFK
jgi:hypothetical protein